MILVRKVYIPHSTTHNSGLKRESYFCIMDNELTFGAVLLNMQGCCIGEYI